MIPSRGACLGVFILCLTVKLRPCRGVEDWVAAAREWPAFLAQALDLTHIAKMLLRDQLAVLVPEVRLSPSIEQACVDTSRDGLLAIAREVMVADPPGWLAFVVHPEGIRREYIPARDLEDLLWIDPDLDQLLTVVHERGSGNVAAERFREWMGASAEKFLMQYLWELGRQPVHVAEISDAYGYDIECRNGKIDRVEVKASSSRTENCFHLSRNEFEKSKLYGPSWRLAQLVFADEAFVSAELNSKHVRVVKELHSDALRILVPPDTASFEWEVSAKIRAPEEMWTTVDFRISPTFSIPGFGRGQIRRGS